MLRGRCVSVCECVYVCVCEGWWGIYSYESHSKMGCERVAYVSCSVGTWNGFLLVLSPCYAALGTL
jgi:hypothetical protein